MTSYLKGEREGWGNKEGRAIERETFTSLRDKEAASFADMK